ncbi:MAG: hypothetical protein GY928_20855 [Colwellia sp.]|nr:hypothetical protein [Colwellia sp.]
MNKLYDIAGFIGVGHKTIVCRMGSDCWYDTFAKLEEILCKQGVTIARVHADEIHTYCGATIRFIPDHNYEEKIRGFNDLVEIDLR